jgi:hypothetical protein
METPRAWKKNLEAGILTLEMVEACLYSINKRAKNYRDLARKYRHSGVPRIYVQDYIDSAEENEIELYKMKDLLLKTLFSPSCIHKQTHHRYDEYGDVYDVDEYFLFYELPNCTFHLPIDELELEEWEAKGVRLEKEVELKTTGENPVRLVSRQFCKKVVELVKSGNYKFIKEELIKEEVI